MKDKMKRKCKRMVENKDFNSIFESIDRNRKSQSSLNYRVENRYALRVSQKDTLFGRMRLLFYKLFKR